MINLDKLNSQIDLNNIDPAQIVKILVENQKPVIIVVIIGSLIVAGMMFNDHHVKETALRTRMSQEQAKLDVIKARDKASQDFIDYKSSIPKELNVFELITLIQNYAKSYNDTVISYTPSQSKNMGLYNIIAVRFDMVSNDFKDMMLFLRKVEKSNFPVRVDEWSGHEGDDGKISYTIEISAVLVHP
jgi:hypothetical protein